MPYICKNCGGDLKADGKGFKCICCGAKFASEDELKPQSKKEAVVQPPKAESAPQAKQPEKKNGLFSKFNLGKKKDESPKEAPKAAEPPKNVQAPVKAEPPKVEEVEVETKSNQGVNVFEDNINGVLEITWQDEKYLHSGSGFLIDIDGYAITNTHVVTHEDGRSCESVNVRLCGETIRADVVKLGDNRHGHGNGVDLALVKLSRVPGNAKVVEIEDFENVKIGEQVFVIGNSLGLGTCITSGIVSDKLRNVNGRMLMMTDCAVNGGNSGGPIFNAQGRVIGAIVSGIDAAEGMNFAIPADVVKGFIDNSGIGMRLIGRRPQATTEQRAEAHPKCPRCGSTNTDVENNICYCYDCEYEW
ncbi:MAG: trypsin-like peptidase domain-containing protein [Clostridia bacterium]|nr:trypsin-like peptidase domain-containing protein [Clostridia bacterium]